MSTTAVQLRVSVPVDILARYEQQASQLQLTVEDLLTARLTVCKDHTAEKPLCFTDGQRLDLDQILGRNVSGARDALTLIQTAMRVRVGKVVVPLQLDLLQKLESRALDEDFDEFLKTTVVECLERYVGMR